MQINQLTLTNFRGFADYSLPLTPQFNLIVGDNSTGKTTLLDALAILASGVVVDRARAVGRSRPIKPEEVRQATFRHADTLTLEPQFPCVVGGQGKVAGESGSWKCSLTAENGMDWQGASWVNGIARKLHDEVKHGDPVALPLVSYYGTERLWVQASRKNGAGAYRSESRLGGYRQCLDPASDQERLLDWFRDQEFASLQQKKEIPTLEACRRAIATCVPGSKHIYFDASLKQLVVGLDDASLPITYLSDGYRNMLTIVADLAIRCATLNPHFESEAALQTSGIVLIDELDLHLHPKWQRQVVTDLMKAFPKLQFVGTTHSPFVIQSLPPSDSVQLINLDDRSKEHIQDKSVEDIAEWVQGVPLPQRSHRYLEMMNKAEEYFEMLADDTTATEQQRQTARKELEKVAMPFSDSPAYHALIKMQELAAQKQSATGNPSAQGGAP